MTYTLYYNFQPCFKHLNVFVSVTVSVMSAAVNDRVVLLLCGDPTNFPNINCHPRVPSKQAVKAKH